MGLVLTDHSGQVVLHPVVVGGSSKEQRVAVIEHGSDDAECRHLGYII